MDNRENKAVLLYILNVQGHGIMNSSFVSINCNISVCGNSSFDSNVNFYLDYDGNYTIEIEELYLLKGYGIRENFFKEGFVLTDKGLCIKWFSKDILLFYKQ